VKEARSEWQTLAQRNEYDIRLYEYAVNLFDEQRPMMMTYASDAAAWNGLK